MKAHRLIILCSCRGVVQPTAIYVTEDGDLLIKGICIKCEGVVHSLKKIASLANIVSSLRGVIRPPLGQPKNLSQEDLAWLHEFGASDEKTS